jgi:hypothetical protein
MTKRWFYTTAVALVIGTGPVVAQQQPDVQRNREESPRGEMRSPSSREADRPAAVDQRPADRLNRAEQPEPRAGAKEPRRGESTSPLERQQAEEPQFRDRAPTKQSQEQRGERSTGPTQQNRTQQSRDEQIGRDVTSPNETRQRQGRDEQQSKQDSRERDVRRQGDSRQREGQQRPERDRNDQAAQPTAIPDDRQGMRPGDTAQDRLRDRDTSHDRSRDRDTVQDRSRDRDTVQDRSRNRDTGQDQLRERDTGQARDQSIQREGRSSITANEQQRTEILERLRRERANENINIRVNVGERLPPQVRPRPLPPEIVRIAPQYRDYEYTVVRDRVAIVDPRTREVVDVIDEPGSVAATGPRFDRERSIITREQSETLRQEARRTDTVGSTSPSGFDSRCVTLRPVPEELARANPELAQYRYLAIGDQIVLVDPREQRIVQVIENHPGD